MAPESLHGSVERLYSAWADSGGLDSDGTRQLLSETSLFGHLYSDHFQVEETTVFARAAQSVGQQYNGCDWKRVSSPTEIVWRLFPLGEFGDHGWSSIAILADVWNGAPRKRGPGPADEHVPQPSAAPAGKLPTLTGF